MQCSGITQRVCVCVCVRARALCDAVGPDLHNGGTRHS